MSIKQCLLCSIVLFFCLSCKDTNSEESSKIEKDSTDSTRIQQENELANKEVKIFAWVNKLRVRESPDTKSKIVIELKEGDSLIYLKEQTDFTQKVNLRGILFDEPWLKVQTSKKQVGWVYGGGVKFYAPKASRKPTLYDECFEFLKEYRKIKFKDCFEKEQALQFKRTKGIVMSSAEGLTLRMLTGVKILLKNNDSEEHPTHYRFYYYYPKMSSFVVEVLKKDKSNFILINDKSGKITEVWGYPKPSPENKQWVTSHANGIDAAGGMQILEHTDHGLEVAWQEEMTEEPYVPFWLDEDTVEVTTKKRSSSRTTVKTLLRSRNGEWNWKK